MLENVLSNYSPHHFRIFCPKLYQTKVSHDLSNEASRTEADDLVM